MPQPTDPQKPSRTPPQSGEPRPPSADGQRPQEWPAQLLGLPREGRGAVAPPGRRFLALILDWVLSLLVVGAVTRTNPWAYTQQGERNSAIALAVMVAEMWLFTCLIAGSAGQVITRIAVVRTRGGLLSPWRAGVRTLLIMLIIPPIVFDRDQRGLHDVAVDSIVVRR